MSTNPLSKLPIQRTEEIIIDSQNKIILEECIKNKTFYGLMPVVGDSMTCDDERSIPNGSKVLFYDLEIDFSQHFERIWHLIPLNEPILIIGTNRAGIKFKICKTISFINAVSGYVKLRSFNPAPEYNGGGLSFKSIECIMKVIQVIK